jgi:23S rRNA G2445 N2-methylase RlmL
LSRRDARSTIESIAALIASPLSKRILETLTEGSIRYRLDFVAKGHQRSVVREIATRAYALCPEILNDAHLARWTVAIYPDAQGDSVELRPEVSPDPRLYFRLQDVPAASHPPLAACMARLAGRVENDIVWDPFCGSGLELIERSLLGGVNAIYGTDLSPEAVAITRKNFEAANVKVGKAIFACCDFRDHAALEGLGPNSATLVITNPPMGKRVPIPDLRQLIDDLLSAAATVLRPGGRLVFANPFRMENPHPRLKLESRRVVDFSGFDCRLELYRKLRP